MIMSEVNFEIDTSVHEAISNNSGELETKVIKVKPCLENFDSDIIKKYTRKFGKVKDPEHLSKKELQLLTRLTKTTLVKQTKTKPKYNRKVKPKKIKKMAESSCKQRIAFDLSYFADGVMKYCDMRKCIKQIHRCYSENRKLSNPSQLHLTSVCGNAEEILSHNVGYQNWDLNIHEKSYLEVFNKEDIVYLTSESENVIESLDDSKVYIIGGLLDHNSQKGMSYKRATEQGISHGRLPVDEYMNMKTLKVFPINHVYKILSLVANGMPWTDAFTSTIPRRKEAIPKNV